MSDDATPKDGAKPKRKASQKYRDRVARVRAAAATPPPTLQQPERLRIPGRPRALDPSQEVLDKNVKTILGAAAMQCTLVEVAALHDVAVETLQEFFRRYPEIHHRFKEAMASGQASVKRNQFKLSEKSPQMAIYLGEQYLGQRDPHKMAALDRQRAEFDAHMQLEKDKLALRERDVAAKERLLELRQPADLGSGLPIDINSLSLAQLMQLATRIRTAMANSSGLTIDAVKEKAR